MWITGRPRFWTGFADHRWFLRKSGAITQHIGATIVPIEAIRAMSGTMEKTPINIPGLLFIDTPGHHAFTTLRARGGALADMAILVVDISQGFQPQTIEALQILRNCRTPFVIAATKIDRIHGWRVNKNESFLSTFAKQNERVKTDIENKTYEIVGKLSDLGFSADRFDRVSDFQRNLAIVPVSAHTGEGICRPADRHDRACTALYWRGTRAFGRGAGGRHRP